MSSSSSSETQLVIQDTRAPIARNYLRHFGTSGTVTKSYDWFVSSARDLIEQTVLQCAGNKFLRFGDIHLLAPVQCVREQKNARLLPSDCTRDGKSYIGKVSMQILQYQYEVNEEGTVTEKLIGEPVRWEPMMFPISVKSNYCHLSQMSSSEIAANNECVNNPGGYFIIGGHEYTVINQERMAPNRIHVGKDVKTDHVIVELKAAAHDNKKVSVLLTTKPKTETGGNRSSKKNPVKDEILKVVFPGAIDSRVNLFVVMALLAERIAEVHYSLFNFYDITGEKAAVSTEEKELTPEEKEQQRIMEEMANQEDHANTVRQLLQDPQQIINTICSWCSSERETTDVAEWLNQTVLEYKAITRLHEEPDVKKRVEAMYSHVTAQVFDTKHKVQYSAVKLSSNASNTPSAITKSEEDVKTEITKLNAILDSNFLVNIWNSDPYVNQQYLLNKYMTLSIMAHRYASTCTGHRGRILKNIDPDYPVPLEELVNYGLDDRDDYANKVVEAQGPLLMLLFSKNWQHQIAKISADFAVKSPETNFAEELRLRKLDKEITITLAQAIRSGQWGLNTGPTAKFTGITRTLQRGSIIGAIADVRSIDTPISRKSRSKEPRNVHVSYYGFICATSTKEGKDCGLAKSLTQGSQIGVPENVEHVHNFLRVNSEAPPGEEDTFVPLVSFLKTEQHPNPLLINGGYYGWVDYGRLRQYFTLARRGNAETPRQFAEQPSISLDVDGFVQILTYGGRLIRPVLVVENRRLLIDVVSEQLGQDLWNEPWAVLVSHGVVDFVDSAEQSCSLIAMYPSDLENDDYDYCEVSPSINVSWETGTAVFAAHNPGTRMTYQSNMAKHAVGRYHAGHKQRYEAAKIIQYAQKPLVKTDIYDDLYGTDDDWKMDPTLRNQLMQEGKTEQEIEEIASRLREVNSRNMIGVSGVNAVVAIATTDVGVWHDEDSLIISRDFIDRGAFMTTYEKVETYEVESSTTERVGKLPTAVPGVDDEKYRAIGQEFPIPGTVLEQGTVILPKYTIRKVRDGATTRETYVDSSIYFKDPDARAKILPQTIDATGRRARVFSTSIGNVPVLTSYNYTGNEDSKNVMKVKYRITRRPQPGDKFASRFSQKGVEGKEVAREDMPFTADGIRPDIMMNPHAYPSRLTIGQMFESLTGLAATQLGERVNATIFNKTNMPLLEKILKENGFSATGTHQMYSGITGEPFTALLFMGPVYYQVLRHMVEDKKHSRSKGDLHILYRQPLEGRARGGGLRQGEMEQDALVANGARGVLAAVFNTNSDSTKMGICKKCQVSIPLKVGKDAYVCKVCSVNTQYDVIDFPHASRVCEAYNYAMCMKTKYQVTTVPTLMP